jgi:hypothetical protein
MHPIIREALDATGLPWQVESGAGHKKIRLAGRVVGVMSYRTNDSDRRATLNVRAQIRRVAKEIRNANR